MKITGILKTSSIQENRAGVEVLEQGAETGTWVSTNEAHLIEACKKLKEGDTVSVDVYKSAGKGKYAGKSYLNIRSIGLDIPEIDVRDEIPDEVEEFQEEFPPVAEFTEILLLERTQGGFKASLTLRIEKI